MSRARPWVLLGLAAVPMLAAWWWWSAGRGAGAGRAGPRAELEQPARSGAEDRRALVGRGADPGHPDSDPDPERLVQGHLSSPEWGALRSGRLELRCADEPELVGYLSVGDDGLFHSSLCGGATCVRLSHPGFQQAQPWVLEPGRVHELTADEAPALEGQVRSSVGEAVGDARLFVESEAGHRGAASSDGAGEFTLHTPMLRPCDRCDIDRGPPNCSAESGVKEAHAARLLVTAPGFGPAHLEVTLASRTHLDVVLPPPASPIEGLVVGIGGQPFAGRTSVLATNMDLEAEQHAARVDEEGRFALESLGEGRYRLRAIRDGLELATAENLHAGDPVELRAGVSAKGQTLRLRVLDAEGAPVAGARVDGGPFRAARTGQDGQVEAPAVSPGSYELRVRAGACPVERTSVDLPPSSADLALVAHTVDHRLARGCQPS